MARVLFILICLLARPAFAQGSYTTTQTGAINGATTCTSELVRTITVADDFEIADVDLGFLATHTWKGDIRLRLVSPAGTSVQLINTEPNNLNADNYNVLLDDEAPVQINATNTAHGTAAPPFENTVRPDAALSAFDGQPSAGTWTLRMCDVFPTFDNGTFQRATLRLTPADPPPAPPLTCPAGAPERLAWTAPGGAYGWTPGSTASMSYEVGGNTIGVAITGDTAQFATQGGTPTPVTSTQFSSGTGEFALLSAVNFSATSQSLTYTMSLGDAGEGFAGLAFDIFDVDGNPGTFQDRYDITASLGGSIVPVTITPTTPANYVDGNSLIGLAAIDRTSAAANGRITLTDPADTLTIIYRPGPSSPADPVTQFMAFSLLDFCAPARADLEARKTVELAGGFALPGTDVSYTITVTNPATSTATAQAIDLSDTLPGSLEFVSASVTGFSGGAFTPLPAANTDCGGGACVIAYAGASLGVGETGELIVLGRIK